MKRLQVLYSYRALIVFILLETISLTIIYHREQYEASAYFAVGALHAFLDEAQRYPHIKAENNKLLQENANLTKRLLVYKSLKNKELVSDIAKQYRVISAHVVNNSIIGTKNYLTLDKGSVHGIQPGMGVMTKTGIVGRVKSVSKHFSTVISLLHTSMQVSAKLTNSQVFGTVQWTGKDPFRAQLLYVPRHVEVELGETVVTSGYNATFFEGTLIGHIKQVVLRKAAPFYDIELTLSTDFSKLQHVYVVGNVLKSEKDALEQQTRTFYE